MPVSPVSAIVQRHFDVSLYILLLTGYATLTFSGGLGSLTIIFVGIALLVRGYLLATRRIFVIPEKLTSALTLIYAAFYIADYFVISGSFVAATVHLVLFVMVVRLFSARRDRDYYFLAVLSFLMVLVASVLTVSTLFLLTFAIFMLAAVVTCILMEMRHSLSHAAASSATGASLTARRMGFSLSAASPVLVSFICILGAVIFFFLPRLTGGYFSAFTATGEVATGFSEHVRLGQIGVIQQSSSVVMHIQIDGDTRGVYGLKWRGITLNVFDGTTWSNSHEQRPLTRSNNGFFVLQRASGETELPRAGRVIHYHVLMEPLVSNVFFLAPTALNLDGNYRFIVVDGAGMVSDPDADHPVRSYTATSNISRAGAFELQNAASDYPAEILLSYLQLPRLDPRIAALAEQVTAGSSNNYDKVAAIEQYLRTNFHYTLQLDRTVPRDPVANFLFKRKEGHCEYFASAMAVMLRALHIPSRVVNGFRTGEFNDLTSQYVIRASNAHSWVEVYFPGYGWVSFDPTPPAPIETRTTFGRLALYLDAMASFWREWIINYDFSHQSILRREAMHDSLLWGHQMQNWAQRKYDSLLTSTRRTQKILSDAPSQWSITGVIVAVLLVMGANATRLWLAIRKRLIAAHPEKSPRAAATIWYERTLRKLARRGLRKSPSQTPAEFAASIPDAPLRESTSRLTEHYERARFGESSEAAARLPELYEEVETATRK